MHPFGAWESFYVIVGSSAAALTGLQFVVIVLSTEVNAQANVHTTSAFGTPTIVHFCAALLVSALLSAPWHSISGPAMAISAFGVTGIAYTLIVVRHARRQTAYAPVLEDWIWHTVIPFVAYTALFTSGILMQRDADHALFVVGGTALLLLFVGIHNAWDSVTYLAMSRRRAKEEPDAPAESAKRD